MIKISHLKKVFGDFAVLDDVSLHVEKGDIYGILGLSGAGKSTLIRCINGLETPDEGEIYFGDEYMAIIWRDLMPKYPGAKGIIDVKCTQGLYEEIANLGGVPEFCQVGSSLIKAQLRRENLIFTGEYAGHIYFNDEHYGYDDAMYAGARMLRILSNTDKTCEEFKAWCIKVAKNYFITYCVKQKNRKFEGQILYSYMVSYAFIRIFTEALRTDSLMLGSFRVSQLVSIIIFVIVYVLSMYKITLNNDEKNMFLSVVKKVIRSKK